jgi:ubiquitin-like protein ATG12
METEKKGSDQSEKIIVHLKPVANAPILKKNRFKVQGSEVFATIINFVSGQLKVKDGIFLYCNSSFSPCADSVIADIFDCFKVGGELIINYAVTEAWG